jgi:hypothetical protein
MIRLIALNAIFFLLPFAGYAAWLVATQGTTGGSRDWSARTIGYLTLGGALLLLIALVSFTSFSGGPPGGTYKPAHVEGGKLVPGTIE